MIRASIRPAIALLLLLALAFVSQRAGSLNLESIRTDPLGFKSRTVDFDLLSTGAGFGLLLLGGWLAGRIAQNFRLPKITGFLLFGVVCGPTATGLIEHEVLNYLKLVDSLAVALIALTAGGEIRLSFLSGAARKIACVLGAQVLIAFTGMCLVGLATVRLLKWDEGISTAAIVLASMLFATVAAASSPAVVIAVISELRARGPLSQTVLSVTICKDLAVIVLFAVIATASAGVFAGAADASAPTASNSPTHDLADAAANDSAGTLSETQDLSQPPPPDYVAAIPLPLQIAWHLLGSIFAGVCVGLAMAFYVHRVRVNLALMLVLSCFAIALFAEALHLDPLIVALVGGMLMRNLWPHETEEFFETIEDLSLPVYCVFFAVAGAKVNLHVLAEVWIWALALTVCRAGLIATGTGLGARMGKIDPSLRRTLWMGFISRAGVSIALANLVAEALGDLSLGPRLYNLILATIALDELAGPLLLKTALTRAGEAEPPDRQPREQ